jgi:hypothetical protein
MTLELICKPRKSAAREEGGDQEVIERHPKGPVKQNMTVI